MKSYLSLIPISNRINRKESKMIRLCIILAVFLVTAIFSMADMEIRCQRNQIVKEEGYWHYRIQSENDNLLDALETLPCVDFATRYDVANYRVDEDYMINGKQTIVCGFDESFTKVFPGTLIKGTFPKTNEEVIISEKASKELNCSIGDSIIITKPDGTAKEYSVSGISQSQNYELKHDVYGMFMRFEAFQQFAFQSEESNYYIAIAKFYHPQKAMTMISQHLAIPIESFQENIKLLGITGMSGNSYMGRLYATAAILAILVIFAGILMIASSMNSNCAKKTQFYGMLRCLGASRKQVKNYVILEALNWCRVAIPIGLLLGSVITCILCIILKYLSPMYFADMPTIAVSPIALISGCTIGILTVVLASLSPARKASRVSPLTAVSGNAEPMAVRNKKIHLWKMPIDVRLGINHACGTKKNFTLMVLAFAFSIILFLAFSTTVDFFQHAIKPVRPYTPDISVCSSDLTNSIDIDMVDTIEKIEGVKRAYGRSCLLEKQAILLSDDDKREVLLSILSYEKNQFDFSKKKAVQGSLQNVIGGNEIAIVYHEDMGIHIGDYLQIETPSGIQSFRVGAFLSDSPFDQNENEEIVICSEDTFTAISGENKYTIIDIQLKRDANVEAIDYIREMFPEKYSISDQIENNQSARGAYYAMALFMYGFVSIIAMISVFQVINSIGMSVNSRMKQYGIMRAIGTDTTQLCRMIATEALTYGVTGILVGCAFGVKINKDVFENMITSRWGEAWKFPVTEIMIILVIMLSGLVLAVYRPIQDMKKTTVIRHE